MPYLFLSTGDKWNDPKNFPTRWRASSLPHRWKAASPRNTSWKERPNGKIAILSQNDDAGTRLCARLQGRTAKGSHHRREVTHETSDPRWIHRWWRCGPLADVFFNMTTPKFAAQAIRKAAELNWKPLHYVVAVASSIKTVLQPAGVENAVGPATAISAKIPARSARWDNDKDVQEYMTFMKEEQQRRSQRRLQHHRLQFSLADGICPAQNAATISRART